jgi:hypothetical protein
MFASSFAMTYKAEWKQTALIAFPDGGSGRTANHDRD